ncbi:Crp/Fnr family transcriptional regulator [Bradyrhizobium jicamae]|uniref:Crp/Fnr family transcriptional regulator n=1 Tax=Bradyrhizobium jicamae TaxID=280332 RepID=UPI001BA8D667|nr:Crp/Fnr family transcriptional regulator [Bradyrhizobium jicamae]MBR0937634.1 Crp/Fnr family transcriptional regulator [Bradyrhizobium jicamae]
MAASDGAWEPGHGPFVDPGLASVVDMDQSIRRRAHPVRPMEHACAPAAAAHEGTFADEWINSRRPGVRRLSFAKARDVVISGSHNRCIYFNHDGWLARYKILHKGSRQILDFVLPGQVFGLPACLFPRAPYSIITITEASVSAIPFDMTDNVFDRDPALAKTLFWSTVQEAAILGEHLTGTGRRSAYERVSHLLLELFVRLNTSHRSGEMTLSIPLTQELIADALGLTAVHVNRTLRALRQDKLIKVDGRSITIVDFEALSRLSDFEKSYLGQAGRFQPRATEPAALGESAARAMEPWGA